MAQYLDATIVIPENDAPHREYLEQQSSGKFTVQKCASCGHLRYPVLYACPDCRDMNYTWEATGGKGTIYSYYVVPHAINPIFRNFIPYPVILVELDEVKEGDYPNDRTLRIVGNLLNDQGQPEDYNNIAIGKRVEVTMVDLGDGMALPQWKLSGEPSQIEEWQIPGPPMAARPPQ